MDRSRKFHPVDHAGHLNVGEQHAHIGPGFHRIQGLVGVGSFT
jgi:hypothetical protein